MVGERGGLPVYLSAKEAAAELDVSLPTLYAYVSRGLVRSENVGTSRAKRYRGDDVRTLVSRRRPTQREERKKSRALSWGAPVLDSAITLISDDGLYYRGRNAVTLAEDSSLETVATLLWNADRDPFTDQKTGLGEEILESSRQMLVPLGVVERGMTLFPAMAVRDPGAFTMAGPPVMKAGVRLMRVFAAAITDRSLSDHPLHEVLAHAWDERDDGATADLVRRALVLSADHELNASTFTVRCVASTGTSVYYAVAAGLAAMKGFRHGGMSASAHAFLESLDPNNMEDGVAARLTRGEDIPGFGHPVYQNGDPRATALLDAMATHERYAETAAQLSELVSVVETMTGRAPNIDIALAGLARQIGSGPQTALAMFALGRTAGWIAHAIEQASSNQLIRPRARYIGEPVKAS